MRGFYLIRLNGRDKNLLLNSTIYFMFYLLFNVQRPQNNGIALPLRLPLVEPSFHQPSVAAASFWLVVAFKIVNRQPFKAAVYFILNIFC